MGDLAFQLWALHLRDLGFTDKINTISIPDPIDLSQSTEKHIVLYPPGVPWLVGGLLKTGLGTSTTVYLLGFAGFLSGGIASLKILRVLHLAPIVQVGMALLLATTCFSRTGLSFLTIGGCDVFCFGLLPWGIYLALTAFPKERSVHPDQCSIMPKKAVLAAALLGIVYLLKYSQFTYACATAFFLIVSCLLNVVRHQKKIAGLFASGGLALIFLVPFAFLTRDQNNTGQDNAVTYTERGWMGESAFILQRYGPFYEQSTVGLPLFATLPAAPGWLNLSSGGAFSSFVQWLRNFTQVDDWIERKLHLNGNIVLSALLGFLGTILIWSHCREYFRRAPQSTKLFLLSLAVIPSLLLAHTGYVKGYNYLLSHENRFGIPAFVILEALLLGYLWQNLRQGFFSIPSKLVLMLFFLHPILASAEPFIDYISNTSKNKFILAEDAVYSPNLSLKDSRTMVETVRQLATNKRDVIIFAGQKAEDGGMLYESAQLALNFPRRCLFFDSPSLSNPLFAQQNPEVFKTSESLRVILLLHKNHSKDFPETRITSIFNTWKKRFPQNIGGIRSEREKDEWNFSVHWLDLEPSPKSMAYHPSK